MHPDIDLSKSKMSEDSLDSARAKTVQLVVAQSGRASSILGNKLLKLLKMHVQEDSHCAVVEWDEEPVMRKERKELGMRKGQSQ